MKGLMCVVISLIYWFSFCLLSLFSCDICFINKKMRVEEMGKIETPKYLTWAINICIFLYNNNKSANVARYQIVWDIIFDITVVSAQFCIFFWFFKMLFAICKKSARWVKYTNDTKGRVSSRSKKKLFSGYAFLYRFLFLSFCRKTIMPNGKFIYFFPSHTKKNKKDEIHV